MNTNYQKRFLVRYKLFLLAIGIAVLFGSSGALGQVVEGSRAFTFPKTTTS